MLHRQVKLFPSSGSQCARTACHVAWASEKGYCAKKKNPPCQLAWWYWVAFFPGDPGFADSRLQ